ncbi:transglycosylase SLT domain-containing protein [Achromobacter denitrificans]|jgi:soluble lytic murein transglycosylase-like protein|uniref:lytic transglycosylase domain-containing protein n=1 Tax=Achromobacter denitrificans TaxID=32002 RepID=UPI003BA063DE
MANELAFRISAIDNASKVGNKVGNSFSRIGDRAARMSGRLTSVGKTGATALGKITSSLNSVSQGARTAADRISSIIPGMSALVGLAGAAGVGALAQRWGDLGASLQRTSRQLGMSTRGLQAWHYAAKRAGVTAEQFDQSMLSSQNTIREAAFGANPQAMMLMQRLGVRVSRGKDGQIDYERTQHDILTALGKIKNPAGQRTAADALGMGALLSMIQRGTFDADRAEAGKRGYIFGDEAIERATVFQDKINGLKASTGALANTIGDKLIPVLAPMIEKLRSWLDENRVNIADRFAEAVGKLTSWIASIDWGAWYERVNKIADAFGGWGNALAGIVAIKFAATMAQWGLSLAALVTSLSAARAAALALQATAAGAAGAAGAGAAAGGIGFGTALGGTALAAAAVGAPIALTGAYLQHQMTGTPEGVKQRIADRRARIKELDELIELDPGSAARYEAEKVPLERDIAEYSAKLEQLKGGQPNAMAAALFDNLEKQHGLPQGLLDSVWLEESGRGRNMLSPAGAQGHFQFMPATAKEWGLKDPNNLEESSEAAARYLKWLLGRTGGDVKKALAAYNGGIGNLERLGLEGMPAESQKYYRDVLGRLGQTATPVGLAGGDGGKGAMAGMGAGPGVDGLKDALDASLQKLTLQVNVSAPPGTRVDATSGDGTGMSTRVNYSMGLGAMP